MALPITAPRPTLTGVQSVSTPTAAPTAAASTTDITALETKFGWAKGQWQDQLLQAADHASNGDGKVSASEIDAYLATPDDNKFLSSTAMVAQSKELAGSGGTLGIRSFQTGWENSVAYKADKLGNGDGSVTSAELTKYFQGVQKLDKGAGEVSWLSDQQHAMFDSKVASVTGEADGLSITGMGGDDLSREYMRIYEDAQHHTANAVTYQLSAADVAMTPADVKRQDNFHADPDYPASSTPTDYTNSGYDRGHQKPAEDSPTQEAMDETFLMTNMAPQVGVLNQQSWRYLETGVRELTVATGGKATVVTGSLYLDASGKPVPEDQIKKIGTSDVAVPKYSYKAVCLQQADGKYQMFAYVVPNFGRLPHDLPGSKDFLEKSRVSVDQLQTMLGGANLFPNLDPSVAKDLKSSMPPIEMPVGTASSTEAAGFLWPQPDSPAVTPKYPTKPSAAQTGEPMFIPGQYLG